jgi:hypothetical protein
MRRHAAWGFYLFLALCAGLGFYLKQQNEAEARRKRALVEAGTSVPAPVIAPPEHPFSDSDMEIYRKIMVSFSTGDFDMAAHDALSALDSATIGGDFREWLLRQLPVLMTSQGWMRIRAQDCDDATKIFYRVLGMAMIPEAQKGLGFCLRVEKSWPEAAGYLAAYVLAKPRDWEGRLMYADTLESLGRYGDAVVALEGALSGDGISPEVKTQIESRLAAMRAKAKSGAGQKTERSDHFFVSFREDDHDAILRDVLDILEAAIAEFSGVLGFAPPTTPIEVILYRKEDFSSVIPGGPGWAEGVFDGRMRIPVSPDMVRSSDGRLNMVLRHELSHALLAHRSQGRNWPTWFDEGVAQYLACRGAPCGQWKFPATPGQFTEPVMLDQPFVTLGSISAGRAYSHSLYLTRFIARHKGESVFDFILSRVPQSGALNSDYVAQAAGWDDFKTLYEQARSAWDARTTL